MLVNMFVLRDRVRIHAPIERCFALSCSLPVVERTLHMRPVAATCTTPDGRSVQTRTTGLVVTGDCVRWTGWKWGMPQLHVSLISACDANRFLQDTMLEGRFRRFQHDHHFRAENDGATILEDEVRFGLPFGALGRIAGHVLLAPYIRATLAARFRLLKQLAEGDEWKQYLGG
jgi:ligand-binding SRPBCC domain-containing protein